jgi:hypothetical protein
MPRFLPRYASVPHFSLHSHLSSSATSRVTRVTRVFRVFYYNYIIVLHTLLQTYTHARPLAHLYTHIYACGCTYARMHTRDINIVTIVRAAQGDMILPGLFKLEGELANKKLHIIREDPIVLLYYLHCCESLAKNYVIYVYPCTRIRTRSCINQRDSALRVLRLQGADVRG